MKNIKIYNYNKNNDCNIISIIVEALQNKHEYFISRSWENGPHIIISIYDKSLNYIEKLITDLRNEMYKEKVSEEYIEKLKKQYINNGKIISELENKGQNYNVLKEHGTIEIVDNDFNYYNTELTMAIQRSRFELQPLLNELYFILENKNISKETIMPILFHEISECYKDDNKNKGFFSYVSHVQGFFELSKNQKLPFSETKFYQMYDENFEKIDEFYHSENEFVNKWRTQWEDLMGSLKEYSERCIDDNYKQNIYEAFSKLKKQYENDFHRNFVKYANENDFVNNIDATAYRFLVNIIYLSLPFLKISALKKQKYIYMAYRYTNYIYGIDWRDIVNGKS